MWAPVWQRVPFSQKDRTSAVGLALLLLSCDLTPLATLASRASTQNWSLQQKNPEPGDVAARTHYINERLSPLDQPAKKRGPNRA